MMMMLLLAIIILVSINSIFCYKYHKYHKKNNYYKYKLNNAFPSTQQDSYLGIQGYDPPDSVVQASIDEANKIDTTDYVVIGSGVGGLAAAALLNYYGYSVLVLESHYLPGFKTTTTTSNNNIIILILILLLILIRRLRPFVRKRWVQI